MANAVTTLEQKDEGLQEEIPMYAPNFPHGTCMPCDQSTDVRTKIRRIDDFKQHNACARTFERLRVPGLHMLNEILEAYMAPAGQEDRTRRLRGAKLKKEASAEIEEQVIKRKVMKEACRRHNLPEDTWAHEKYYRPWSAEFMQEKGWLTPPEIQTEQEEETGLVPGILLRDFAQAFFQAAAERTEYNIIAQWFPSDDVHEDEETRKRLEAEDEKNMRTGRPRKGRWRKFKSAVAGMGSIHSIFAWCRMAEQIMAMINTHGDVICLIYIDDVIVPMAMPLLRPAAEYVDTLFDRLGFYREQTKATSHELSAAIRVLGVTYRRTPLGFLTAPTAGRIQKTLIACQEAIQMLREVNQEAARKNPLDKQVQKQIQEGKIDRKSIWGAMGPYEQNILQKAIGGLMSCLYDNRERGGHEYLELLWRPVGQGIFLVNVPPESLIFYIMQAALAVLEQGPAFLRGTQRKVMGMWTDASRPGDQEDQNGKEREYPTIGGVLVDDHAQVLGDLVRILLVHDDVDEAQRAAQRHLFEIGRRVPHAAAEA